MWQWSSRQDTAGSLQKLEKVRKHPRVATPLTAARWNCFSESSGVCWYTRWSNVCHSKHVEVRGKPEVLVLAFTLLLYCSLDLSSWPKSCLGSSCLCFPSISLRDCSTGLQMLRDSNSGPHACRANSARRVLFLADLKRVICPVFKSLRWLFKVADL